MGSILCSKHKHGYSFTISFLFLFILSSTQFKFKAEGRVVLPKSASFSQTVIKEEEKMMMRSEIGSMPPRCERRCSSCVHCEAIEVPTNPQIDHANNNYSSLNVAYARADDASNYKPMSWKCKCGNSIFNP